MRNWLVVMVFTAFDAKIVHRSYYVHFRNETRCFRMFIVPHSLASFLVLATILSQNSPTDMRVYFFPSRLFAL